MQKIYSLWTSKRLNGNSKLFLNGYGVKLIENIPPGYLVCAMCKKDFFAQYFWGYYHNRDYRFSAKKFLIHDDKFCGYCVRKLHLLADMSGKEYNL